MSDNVAASVVVSFSKRVVDEQILWKSAWGWMELFRTAPAERQSVGYGWHDWRVWHCLPDGCGDPRTSGRSAWFGSRCRRYDAGSMSASQSHTPGPPQAA